MMLLFTASIIQRGNDLLKEQLHVYKGYNVVYFQHANSHVVPLKWLLLILLIITNNN